MNHAPVETKVGFACSCGERFVKKDDLDQHIVDAVFNAEEVKVAQERQQTLDQAIPSNSGDAGENDAITPPKEKPKTKEVTKVEPKTITPIQRVQADVVRFATKLVGSERASEFATRVALIARENTKIAQIIATNPDNFLTVYMASVTLGLMPNTPEQYAYIIPYGDKLQFQTGYRGLLQLARRSGEIKNLSAELVFLGDDFDVQFGTERKITHKPDLTVNRTDYSKVTHAYAAAQLTNGETQFVVMTRDEINKVQGVAKASSTDSPWKQWPERMALKTVLKRLTQLLPMSTDDALRKAVAYDNLSEAGKLRLDHESGEVIEGEVVEVRQSAIDAIHAAQSREEVNEVLQGLPVDERKKAATIASQRIKELA